MKCPSTVCDCRGVRLSPWLICRALITEEVGAWQTSTGELGQARNPVGPNGGSLYFGASADCQRAAFRRRTLSDGEWAAISTTDSIGPDTVASYFAVGQRLAWRAAE